jgi:hypothetical protein
LTKYEQLDCVAMKRKASLLLHEKLSRMTHDERIAYWKMRAQEMIEERKAEREKDASPTPSRSPS